MSKRHFKEIANAIEDEIFFGTTEIRVSTGDAIVKNELGVTIIKWLTRQHPQIKVIYI